MSLLAPHRASASNLARVALALGLASVLGLPAASAERVIGPQQEARVLALFAPADLGDEVVPGYRLMDVAIRGHEVVVRLEASEGSGAAPPTLSVELRALGEPIPAGMAHVGDTPSFQIVAVDGLGEPAREVLSSLAARVRGNDSGRFWVDVAIEAAADPGAADALSLGVVARWLVLAALLATLAVTLVARRTSRSKRSEHVE